MSKILTLLITYHNKTEEEVKRILSSLSFYNKELIEVMWIYREIDDGVLEIINSFKDSLSLNIIKVESGRKNMKIKRASLLAEGKYIQVIDPDDVIDVNNLNEFVLEIQNNEEDVILNTHIQNGVLKETYLPKNHSFIFKKELLDYVEVEIYDNIVSQDIYFCNLLFLSSNTFVYKNKPFYHYIINPDNENHMSSMKYLKSNIDIATIEYDNNIQQIKEVYENYKFENKKNKEKFYIEAIDIFEYRKRIIEGVKENE